MAKEHTLWFVFIIRSFPTTLPVGRAQNLLKGVLFFSFTPDRFVINLDVWSTIYDVYYLHFYLNLFSRAPHIHLKSLYVTLLRLRFS